MILQCIALDLDGTIAHYDGWKGGHHVGDPLDAAMEFVKSCHAEGHEIWIFTAREEHTWDNIWRWLRIHGMKEYISGVTNIKLGKFSMIVDDRAHNFSGKFPEIEFINKFNPWWKIHD